MARHFISVMERLHAIDPATIDTLVFNRLPASPAMAEALGTFCGSKAAPRLGLIAIINMMIAETDSTVAVGVEWNARHAFERHTTQAHAFCINIMAEEQWTTIYPELGRRLPSLHQPAL